VADARGAREYSAEVARTYPRADAENPVQVPAFPGPGISKFNTQKTVYPNVVCHI